MLQAAKAGSVEETGFLRSVRILPAKGGAAVSPELLPVRNLVLTCSPTPSFPARAGHVAAGISSSPDIDSKRSGSTACAAASRHAAVIIGQGGARHACGDGYRDQNR
jgi:hypothetical protein